MEGTPFVVDSKQKKGAMVVRPTRDVFGKASTAFKVSSLQRIIMGTIGVYLLYSRIRSAVAPPTQFTFDDSAFLFQTATAAAESNVSSKPRVPRIIHQSYKSQSQLPEVWSQTPARWQSLHEDYEYKFWSDEENRNLIREHYSWFLDTYDSYAAPIQRADAARYFAVLHHGGIYGDLDIVPLRSVSPLLQWLDSDGADREMIVAETYNLGLTNALFASIPNATTLRDFVRTLPHHAKPLYGFEWLTPHFAVLLSTGPTRFWIFLNGGYRHRILTLPPEGWGQCHQCHQHQQRQRQQGGKCIAQENAFFETTIGGSWHKWDTRIMNFIFCHYQFVIWGALCILTGLFQFIWMRRRQKVYWEQHGDGGGGGSDKNDLLPFLTNHGTTCSLTEQKKKDDDLRIHTKEQKWWQQRQQRQMSTISVSTHNGVCCYLSTRTRVNVLASITILLALYWI